MNALSATGCSEMFCRVELGSGLCSPLQGMPYRAPGTPMPSWVLGREFSMSTVSFLHPSSTFTGANKAPFPVWQREEWLSHERESRPSASGQTLAGSGTKRGNLQGCSLLRTVSVSLLLHLLGLLVFFSYGSSSFPSRTL